MGQEWGTGRVIVSQRGGANWLTTDAATGALLTQLCGGRQAGPLYSGAIITDDNWHRVAFTCDGSNRRLYVDDILVAEDTDVALADSSGGLNIGYGAILEPGTFFSGQIDDVRRGPLLPYTHLNDSSWRIVRLFGI